MPKKPPPLWEKVCSNCKHWKEETETGDDERAGECRANPPAVLYDTEEGVFSLWPATTANDWCGGFHAKEH